MMESNYSDEQLIELVHENNEEAKSMLFDRYKDKIDFLIKKYVIVAKNLGIDIPDLNQEALVGFTDAILNYVPGKDASVSTFICLCVERKIKKACIKASTTKHQAMKDTLSLEYFYDDIDASLKELIEDSESDPLIKMAEEEEYEELLKTIKESLTPSEDEVFELLITGLNYRDIAELLDKEVKQIDNALQRIKFKIKKILNNRANE
ncbi:MAG: sigma-70 family RNA polymerase sigma factor [Bacilli bacterium]|nr:sigma-70 family RNA polymerase sigma factor [Bacilli bacterium]